MKEWWPHQTRKAGADRGRGFRLNGALTNFDHRGAATV